MKIDKKKIFEHSFFLIYTILIFLILIQFAYLFDRLGFDKLNFYLKVVLMILFGYLFFWVFIKFGFFLMEKIGKKLFKEVNKNGDRAK
jgi:hypothetical protein